MHAKLRAHKAVSLGASLHRLIYNVLTDIVFPIACHYLTLKNISGAYAQHKRLNRFKGTVMQII